MIGVGLTELFEKAVFLNRGTRIQRLRKAPGRLFYSKILEFISLWARRSLRVKAKTFWGDDMLVVIPEAVSSHIYRYRFFEEGLTGMLLEYLKPGMTFFDIGAHFGYFTLLSATLVGDEGQVHSFEPTLNSFNVLKANVSGRENVFLNRCAALSERKVISINDYGIKYSAFNSMYNARLPKEILRTIQGKRYEVEGICIDDYVESNDAVPDFVKIDAESSEYEILLGMEQTIDEHHPMISIEVGDMGVKGVATSKDLINFLVNRGYQPYELREGKIWQHAFKDEEYEYGNMLFLVKQ